MTAGWDEGLIDEPLPPQNGQVVNPYIPGILDLRWDDPALLAGNSVFTVVGVNIYRSDASDRGPYYRLNSVPVGGGFYRDLTTIEMVRREVISWETGWVSKGDAPNDRRWVLRTERPIVKSTFQAPHNQATPANAPSDVTVYVDNVEVPVDSVFGPTGEITLVNVGSVDVARQRIDAPLLPTETSTVEVTYYASRNIVRSGLELQTYYRFSTVVIDLTTPSGYRETPLGRCPPAISGQTETMDYIWREAVRRNQWILQQGGERAKVFIRRTAGIPCSHGLDPQTIEFGGQPSQRCLTCFGTGFVGGFDGPFDIIMAPDDAERKVAQSGWGRSRQHSQEVWMGPSPVVTMRDFIVKQTNERYSIGPVRRPTNRGVFLQQHFTLGSLDEADIRYAVPIDGVEKLTWPQTRSTVVQAPTFAADGMAQSPEQKAINGQAPDADPWPVGPTAEAPMGTDDGSSSPDTEQRGRTPVWANINR